MRLGSTFAPFTVVKRLRDGRVASVAPVRPVVVDAVCMIGWNCDAERYAQVRR